MRPYLNYKTKTLLSRLRHSEIVDYECVKNALLREFQPYAQSYLHKFNTITTQNSETYSSFASHVRVLLLYYIESHHVKTNNDQLLDLLVSDRFSGYGQCHYHIVQVISSGVGHYWPGPAS